MKKTLLLAVTLFLALTSANGQLNPSSYFMEGSPQRMAFNPAFRPYRGYVQIPGLGNLNLLYTSNTFSWDRLLIPFEGRDVLIFDMDIPWSDVEGFLSRSNDMDFEVSAPLVSFGFFLGRGFLSFDSKVKTDAGLSLPKELFRAIKDNHDELDSYNLGGIKLAANAYLTASVGYSYRIFENLTAGARVNFLGGLAHASAQYDRLNITQSEKDVWNIDAAGSLLIAASGVNVDERFDTEAGRNIVNFDTVKEWGFGNVRGLSGFGMTFDLGVEYELLDRARFSVSLLDLGFMRWNKRNVTYATSEASYTYDKNSGFEQLNNLDDLLEFIRFDKQEQSPDIEGDIYSTFVIGGEYDIFADSDLLGVGAMYMNKKTQFIRRSEFSLALTVRPINWFTASLSYAVRNYSIGDSALNSFGLALNFHPSWINFYIGTDYMFARFGPQSIPLGQKTMNFYMGLSVPLARERSMKLPKLGI